MFKTVLLALVAFVVVCDLPAHAQQWHQRQEWQHREWHERGPIVRRDYPREFGRRYYGQPHGYQQYGWRPMPPPMYYRPQQCWDDWAIDPYGRHYWLGRRCY